MRDDARNYIVVGLFVIAMVTGLILWIALLSGRTGATDAYFVEYEDVTGLASGTQILFQGYPVGLIERVSRVADGGEPRFRVDVSVERGWPIPEDSVAEVRASGLLGGYVIGIREGTSSANLEPGERIPSKEAADVFTAISGVADQLEQLIEAGVKPLVDDIGEQTPQILGNLETFTTRINDAVVQINELLSPDNTQRVAEILQNLETTSAEAATLTNGLEETREQLERVLGTVDRLVVEHEDDLGHTLTDLHHSLEAIARHIDAISSNLEVTTRNMNEFSRQVRQNPGVILRGREVDDAAGSP